MNYSTYTENTRKEQGWTRIGTQLYYFSTEKKNWQESRQDCKNKGGDLIIINSQQEQDIIRGMDVWIGLTDREHEGAWKWVDGTPLTTKYWREGEPNNIHDEDCAYNVAGTTHPIGWNDANCDAKCFSVCEKAA
ncbi:CD209 antigen-like protein D [Brienomyrus brachyistius]|uniref:CD209 antigen-like protein D n=1 Tax=Brienomyrus brachyistius TaxID=42636 RepID=UPI0020B447EC|nr:CD209 antigen-like protein D [Brienomyrus brachyistius]